MFITQRILTSTLQLIKEGVIVHIKDLKLNRYTVNMSEYEKEYGESFKVYCELANLYNPFSKLFDPEMATINLLISDKCTVTERANAINAAEDWQEDNGDKVIKDFNDIHIVFQQGHKLVNYI